MMMPILEIAANSIASACAAQIGGAARVELCSALELGGLTPSHATIALARERLSLPVHVLIRPRSGDFLYDDDECKTMLRDIQTCKTLGCDGVVLGTLDADANVDMTRCRALIAAADGMSVTFHRAFDMTRDPQRALEDIVALGCARILTSGTRMSAEIGASMIRALIEQADGRIIVMPGCGIHPENIAKVFANTGARELHGSASRRLPSHMRHHRRDLPDMDTGELRTDVDRVRTMVQALQACAA